MMCGGFFMKKMILTEMVMWLVTSLLLVAFSFCVYYFKLEQEVIESGIILIYMLSGLSGGCVLCHLYEGKNRWKNQLEASGIYCVIFTLFRSIWASGRKMDFSAYLLMVAVVVLSSLIGGFRKKKSFHS